MKQNVFKSIADLRFAIFILLMIAALSVIGTVIEQDQSIETYKLNYPLTNKVFGFLLLTFALLVTFVLLVKGSNKSKESKGSKRNKNKITRFFIFKN